MSHCLPHRALLALMAVITLLQGCAATVGAGVAGGAAAAYDRRTAGTVVDDQVIELKALDLFYQPESEWSQSHINTTSYNGIVLLTGETPNEALRTRAADSVRRLAKVRQVHNEIVVAAPSSMLSRSGDTWITGKVKTNLLHDKVAKAGRIKVVTEQGIVYLMGLVTRAEANVATQVARRVGGVQRVVKLFEYLD